jgi:tRNA modification GTPase
MYVTDTIAAVATPAGPGGVGIVRVSDARAIATMLVHGATPVSSWLSHRLYQGSITDEAGKELDHGLAVLMLKPGSYTGEDVLELHCHGSPIVLRLVLAAALRGGARLAEPGEFTRRAFLNGRLDLAQAEAVIDLVRAPGNAAAAVAAAQLAGGLSSELARIRDDILQLKALLEAQIDFSEEDFEVDRSALRTPLDTAATALQALIDSYRTGKLAREGLRVVIAGKPNVGKSSLLNALLNEERAIVTPVAGTTRDTIEEFVDFGGIPVLLTDTAGLRPLVEADPIERMGIERTSTKLTEAEVRLLVLDASGRFGEADEAVLDLPEHKAEVIVLNKTDLVRQIDARRVAALRRDRPLVEVSARTRQGLERLRQAVIELVEGGDSLDLSASVLTNLRHVDALSKALAALEKARQSIEEMRPPDLVAVDVQDAIEHIGALTGRDQRSVL